jgi:hypothetical protein
MFSLGHAVLDTANYVHLPCWEVFVNCVHQENKLSYLQNYSALKSFALAACSTKNPDIIWSIAKVESNFNFKIIGVEGKRVIRNENEINEYLKNSNNNSNFDIGPMQINWKYHASKSGYPAKYFFDGSFSVYYVTKNIISVVVKSCKKNWVNCYHSYNSNEGNLYKVRIFNADKKLRMDLKKLILSSYGGV